jgi:hypothetical protein
MRRPSEAEVQARLAAVRQAEAERRLVIVTDHGEGWGILLALFQQAKAGAKTSGREKSHRIADWLAACDTAETMNLVQRSFLS